MNLKSELEQKKISKNCFLKTYITYDEKTYILEINYLDGKFIAERSFHNNYNGIAYMEEVKNQFRTEEDIRKYFDII